MILATFKTSFYVSGLYFPISWYHRGNFFLKNWRGGGTSPPYDWGNSQKLGFSSKRMYGMNGMVNRPWARRKWRAVDKNAAPNNFVS